MKKVVQEFKEFAIRGNVVDMAIGIIIGGAFGKIVNSLVQDVVMPPIAFLTGKVNFADLYISLSGVSYSSLEQARAAGAPILHYGMFLNHIISFIIVAICAFFIVKQVNVLRRKEDVSSVTPTQKSCSFCFTSISIKATRCPQCTSQLHHPQSSE